MSSLSACAETKLLCATSFCNLSTTFPLKMIEAGVPRTLITLVETGDADTMVVAIQAIANMLNHEKVSDIYIYMYMYTYLYIVI